MTFDEAIDALNSGDSSSRIEDAIRSVPPGGSLPDDLRHQLRRALAAMPSQRTFVLECLLKQRRIDLLTTFSDVWGDWFRSDSSIGMRYDFLQFLAAASTVDAGRVRECLQFARKRIRGHGPIDQRRGAFSVLIEVDSVEMLAEALHNDGDWLDTEIIAEFIQRVQISDRLVRALESVWRSSPVWWQEQIAAAFFHYRRSHYASVYAEMLPDRLDAIRASEVETRRRDVTAETSTSWSSRGMFSMPWCPDRRSGTHGLAIEVATLNPLPEVLGMPLSQHVGVWQVRRLRFRFLLDEATALQTDGRAEGWFLRNEFASQQLLQQIRHDEKLCDSFEQQWFEVSGMLLGRTPGTVEDRQRERVREQLRRRAGARIHHLLSRVSSLLWDSSTELDRQESTESRLLDELRVYFEQIQSVLRESRDFQGGMIELTEGFATYRAAHRRLLHVSTNWMRRMDEYQHRRGEPTFPLQFPRLSLEGVLGEYHWQPGQIVTYPLMIDWVARDVAQVTRQAHREATRVLDNLVLEHEALHAVAHLGMDSEGNHWQDPTEASLAFHESLTHWLTRAWALPKMDVARRAIFSEMERRLPVVYRQGSWLPDPTMPGAIDGVRHTLLRRNRYESIPSALSMALRVMAIVKAVAVRLLAEGRIGETQALLDRHRLPTPPGFSPSLPIVSGLLAAVSRDPIVWREIAQTDLELWKLLTTPHLVECSLFFDATQGGPRFQSVLRAFTQEDLRKHGDRLTYDTKDLRVNRLMTVFNHRTQLQALLSEIHDDGQESLDGSAAGQGGASNARGAKRPGK